MNKDKNLILVRGLPGSGKTTFANTLAHLPYTYPVSADDFFYDEYGEYRFDANLLGAAHGQCKSTTENYLREYNTVTVVVHNTFTTQKELKPYLQLAEKYNAGVTTLVVENRHGNDSVHNVPSETIIKMKDRFTILL